MAATCKTALFLDLARILGCAGLAFVKGFYCGFLGGDGGIFCSFGSLANFICEAVGCIFDCGLGAIGGLFGRAFGFVCNCLGELACFFFCHLAEVHFVRGIAHRFERRLVDAVRNGIVPQVLEVPFDGEQVQNREQNKADEYGLDESEQKPKNAVCFPDNRILDGISDQVPDKREQQERNQKADACADEV